MKPEIVQKGDAVLTTLAKPVDLDVVKTPEFQQKLVAMKMALDGEPDGVAIAAPQVGISERIFLVSEKAYPKNRKDRHTVFINPKIINHSKTKKKMSEGCLSVRWKYGDTKRYKQATVQAWDEHGNEFTMSGSGLIAQIFQHEIDHLDGVLFDAHAENLRDLTEEEIRDYQQQLQSNQ